MRPITAACWTSRRSKGSSASSRAASTACTVSGSSALCRSPSSAIRRAISSANSGLPPERSTTAADTVAPAGSSAPTSDSVSAGLSGSSIRRVAEPRPPPQLGRRSNSSSRARQTIISGARTHWARCSIASSMPSSAQWMSSKASTSGLREAIASMPARRAAKNDSRRRSGSSPTGTSSGGTSSPIRRAIRAVLRSASSRIAALVAPNSSSVYSRSLPQASSAESLSTIPHSSRSTSPSAQNTIALP